MNKYQFKEACVNAVKAQSIANQISNQVKDMANELGKDRASIQSIRREIVRAQNAICFLQKKLSYIERLANGEAGA